MPERFARITALALLVILIIALPLLISLFGVLNAPAPTPTIEIAVLAASPTLPAATNTLPPPTATSTATPEPSPSPTVGCPIPATPEPLWVDPITSPTNALSQKITVILGRGREISASTEAGTVSVQGEYSTATPVELQVPLAPNAENHLVVVGRVEYSPTCFYTLQTRVDRVGGPLVIVQTSVLIAPTPVITPTPPGPGTVFIKPFSQIFALNQESPSPADRTWLYTAPDPNANFQVMSQQGAFTRLLSAGGTLNFWTLNENIVPTPSPAAQYDASVADAPVEFINETIFACEAQYPRPLILGLCTEITPVTTGEAIERVRLDISTLYLVRIDNRLYWVSANVLKQEP